MNPSGFNRFAPRHTHFHNKYQPFCSNFMVRRSWVGGWHIGTGKNTKKKRATTLIPAWLVYFQLGRLMTGLSTIRGWWRSNQKSGCQLNRGCSWFYPTILRFRGEPKIPKWFGLGISGWNPSTSYGSNTLGFFSRRFIVRWYRSWSVLKKQLFWKSHLQEQKQKHIVDFTFNDLYILKGDFGKGLMKSIERLERTTKFSTTDVTDGQHLFSRPVPNSFRDV